MPGRCGLHGLWCCETREAFVLVFATPMPTAPVVQNTSDQRRTNSSVDGRRQSAVPCSSKGSLRECFITVKPGRSHGLRLNHIRNTRRALEGAGETLRESPESQVADRFRVNVPRSTGAAPWPAAGSGTVTSRISSANP